MRPKYVAPYKGLQGATAHTAATATPGRTHSLFDKCTGFFSGVTQHMGPTALRPIRWTKQLCLA